ncbi:hypothetical protein ABTA38_19605, partial [Acinetobacter baumannii]
MKMLVGVIAAATALAAVAAAPASAQPYGPPDDHHGRGWHHGYGHIRLPPTRLCHYRHHRQVCR